MSTPPSTPEPEQIVPPPPTPRRTILLIAVTVVAVLVGFVVVLRLLNRPEKIDETNLAGLPILGDPKAPLTIFEYANFGCEHCAKVLPLVKTILARYEGKIKLVYIHYPQGEVNTRAAMAGVCAANQGKFWPFADLMFERQTSWIKDPDPVALWIVYAGQVEIDTNLFMKCLRSNAAERAISQQLIMAGGSVIQSTPTFLIGDSRLVNPHFEDDFARVIDKELNALHGSRTK
jgi:protein-disulfide isomerase